MNDAPILYFQKLFSAGTSIRLLNVYKGLPIANEANITAVEADTIRVNSIKAQIVCMFLEHKTFIQNPALPYIVQANVMQLDSARMEVRLGQFRYMNGRIGERKQVRVNPVDKLRSEVQPKSLRGVVKAELADISQSGLAIYLPMQVYMPEIFAIGSEMIVHLTLPIITPSYTPLSYNAPARSDPMARFDRENLRGIPSSNTPIISENDDKKGKPAAPNSGHLVIRAEIMNIQKEQGRVRIGMRQFPNLETQTIIANFVNYRQAELVREVKTLYEMLNKFER